MFNLAQSTLSFCLQDVFDTIRGGAFSQARVGAASAGMSAPGRVSQMRKTSSTRNLVRTLVAHTLHHLVVNFPCMRFESGSLIVSAISAQQDTRAQENARVQQ